MASNCQQSRSTSAGPYPGRRLPGATCPSYQSVHSGTRESGSLERDGLIAVTFARMPAEARGPASQNPALSAQAVLPGTSTTWRVVPVAGSGELTSLTRRAARRPRCCNTRAVAAVAVEVLRRSEYRIPDPGAAGVARQTDDRGPGDLSDRRAPIVPLEVGVPVGPESKCPDCRCWTGRSA